MISFPNCKINLGLSVIGKRSDGFHDIETVFYPLPLTDALEIIPADDKKIEFVSTGIKITTASDDNLCVKAFEQLRSKLKSLPPVKMHLHKHIPIGAGLGGGSADASFTLQLLNKLFKLELSQEQMLAEALLLGSDCPFFIINKPCVATGIGEILRETPVDLSSYEIVIVNPGIHMNTGSVFNLWKGKTEMRIPPSTAIKLPVHEWKDQLKNELELIVFNKHPEIKQIKDKLYEQGALYSSMSGSGSSVYGIFEKNTFRNEFPSDYFVAVIPAIR